MKRTIVLAATLAVFCFAVSPASAQPADAQPATTPSAVTASTSVAVGTPPAPAATPEPAKTSNVFFPQTYLQAITFRELLYNMAVEFGIDWAHKMGRNLPNLADKETMKDLANLPEGAIAQMSYPGKERMNRKGFDGYLTANQCTVTGTNEKTKDKLWSDGCYNNLAAKMAPLVKAAIDSTKAEPAVKANAQFLYEKAMADGKPENGLQGDRKVAMLSLAALMLPMNEWAGAFGLTNDLSVKAGKNVCVLKKDGSDKVCGSIEKMEMDGVTVNGEKIPFGEIRSICFGNEEECEDLGGDGGTNNDGLHLSPDVAYRHIFAPDQTGVHMFSFGFGVGYTLSAFPLTLRLSAGGMNAFGGGQAPHYTTHITGMDRWDGYVKASAGLRPKFTDTWGLSAMAGGMATFGGGGAFDVEVGPEIYMGDTFSLIIAAQGGYMDLGKAFGDNEGSDLPNPRAQGGTLGFSASGTFSLF